MLWHDRLVRTQDSHPYPMLFESRDVGHQDKSFGRARQNHTREPRQKTLEGRHFHFAWLTLSYPLDTQGSLPRPVTVLRSPGPRPASPGLISRDLPPTFLFSRSKRAKEKVTTERLWLSEKQFLGKVLWKMLTLALRQ